MSKTNKLSHAVWQTIFFLLLLMSCRVSEVTHSCSIKMFIARVRVGFGFGLGPPRPPNGLLFMRHSEMRGDLTNTYITLASPPILVGTFSELISNTNTRFPSENQ